MNEAHLSFFDAGNAARLCEASADAYGDSTIDARETDTHVCLTCGETDLIVAFRGTTDLRNWLTDLDCAWDLEDGCRVHRGFARALDSAQSQLDAEVFSARREGLRIWLTGHSLGGALAMLYAWRFFAAYRNAPFSGIYTFGQPRVGNAAFRDDYNFNAELFGRTFRVVHADDVIPRIPWLIGTYRHAGHEVFYPSPSPFPLPQGEGGGTPREGFLVDPSSWAKLPWDIRNAWRELRREKFALLADHHVDTYLELFQTDPVSCAEISEWGRVCR